MDSKYARESIPKLRPPVDPSRYRRVIFRRPPSCELDPIVRGMELVAGRGNVFRAVQPFVSQRPGGERRITTHVLYLKLCEHCDRFPVPGSRFCSKHEG